MAEAISGATSFTTVLQLSRTVLRYLVGIQDNSADRKSLIREISYTRGVLSTLNEIVGDAGISDGTTAATIQSLGLLDDALRVLKTTLQQLAATLERSASATRIQSEVKKTLKIIEHERSRLSLALEKNYIAIPEKIRNNTRASPASQVDQTVERPLLLAAQTSDTASVKLLLDAVKLLLEAGASLESKSNSFDTSILRKAVERMDVQMVQDILTYSFADVARDDYYWLHELVEMGYQYPDIAQLLVLEKRESPWIFIKIKPTERLRSTFVVDLHQAFCVHQGGNELTFSPRLIVEDEDIRHITNRPNSDLPGLNSIKREVAAFCGLAGDIPVSSDRQEWIGSVTFDAEDSAVAYVTYEIKISQTTSIIQDYLLRVEAALERLVNIIARLQQNGLCCNSFTTLKLSTEIGRVEAIQIPLSIISLLVDAVSCLRSSERKREILDSALKVAQEILDLVYGVERDRAAPFDLKILDLESAERTTVQNCALATQSLCLGLLSYSNAHAGPIQPFFLSRALERVNLLGIEMHLLSLSPFSAQLVELTCFGQMIGNAVVAFTRTKKLTRNRKYDLLVSPEDLIDTWGPGRFVIDGSSSEVEQLCAIEIGGGIIRPTVDDATLFHWDRHPVDHETLKTRFDSRTKILIAATELNELCPLDQFQSWPVCTNSMKNLGTCQDYWRLAQMQAGSQAGQYIMLQFNGTWVKQDGITLKDRQLNAAPGTIYLPFLDSLWGLQVSLCTGVARRVLIREMLADVMVAYVENRLPVPPLWKDLLNDHAILRHFREPNLTTWFQKLPPELQTLVVHIVRYILGILGDTGYDRQNDELVIAWPFPEDPFRCFRIPCRNDLHLWTKALADSEDCATFAYITPKCLEDTNGQSCRRVPIVQWQNRAVSLNTAVCQHQSSKETRDQAVPWILEPDIPYWIGKPSLGLKAQVLKPTTRLEMRLSITRSLIPESFRRRMLNLQRIPVHRIREKQQSMETNATQVLIITARKSDP
ncbi:hypothetical protein MMC11_002747 [Xylographa trunciseda]|nr:hypothetical protein [Xylographa trunciseda]